MESILVIGLGNPGDKYARTRHNAGFLAIDALGKKLGITLKKNADFHAEVGEGNVDGIKVVLAKPQTFMNESGSAVAALRDFFHAIPKNIWLITDDVALPLGTLRMRDEGSAGGHNGLKSVIATLDTELFPRFKIGVDAPPQNVPLEAWVLSRFSDDEMVMLKEVITQTVEAVMDALKDGVSVSTKNIG